MRWTRWAVAAAASVVAVTAAGCTSGVGTASGTGPGGNGPGGNGTHLIAGRVTPAAGPVPVAAPLTGGTGIDLVSAGSVPALPTGWVEAE